MEAEARELALLVHKVEADSMAYVAKLQHYEKKEKEDVETRKRLETKIRESQENEARYFIPFPHFLTPPPPPFVPCFRSLVSFPSMAYVAKLEHYGKKEKEDAGTRKRLHESQENEAGYSLFLHVFCPIFSFLSLLLPPTFLSSLFLRSSPRF